MPTKTKKVFKQSVGTKKKGGKTVLKPGFKYKANGGGAVVKVKKHK